MTARGCGVAPAQLESPPAVLTGDLGRVYRNAVDRLDARPEAAIPIEELDAPVLLICGELDRLWPACPLARQLRARAVDAGGPTVELLAQPLVGHADLEPPRSSPDVGPRPRWGGTAANANQARAESWDAILRFLDAHLDSPVEDDRAD